MSEILPLLCESLFSQRLPQKFRERVPPGDEYGLNVGIYDVLDGIRIANYPKQTFCEYVEREYKRFMVLKAIEAREPVTADNPWNIRCQPSCLVDEFWHAHMLQPRKYQAFCQNIGEVIHREPGYVAVAATGPGTTTDAKLDMVFKNDGYDEFGLISVHKIKRMCKWVSTFSIEDWKGLLQSRVEEIEWAIEEYELEAGYFDDGY